MVDGLDGQWRPVLWLVFACSCLVLAAICVIGDETWYDRSLPVQPERPGGVYGRILNLTGVTGFRERKYKAKVFPSIMRQLEVFTKPVMWAVFVIYALSFMYVTAFTGHAKHLTHRSPRKGGLSASTSRRRSYSACLSLRVATASLCALCRSCTSRPWSDCSSARSVVPFHLNRSPPFD